MRYFLSFLCFRLLNYLLLLNLELFWGDFLNLLKIHLWLGFVVVELALHLFWRLFWNYLLVQFIFNESCLLHYLILNLLSGNRSVNFVIVNIFFFWKWDWEFFHILHLTLHHLMHLALLHSAQRIWLPRPPH